MATLSWTKLKGEINKVADLDRLKSEIHKLGTELSKYDISSFMSPTAKKRLADLEKRYAEGLKALTKGQRQFDREFNKALRTFKTHKKKAEAKIEQLRKNIAKGKKSTRKKTSRKTSTRKKASTKA